MSLLNTSRNGWACAVLLFIISVFCLAQASSDSSLSSLHEELTTTIQDLQIHGEPENFDASLKSLINQLELLQVPPGKPLQLDWSGYSSAALTGQKSVCLVVSSFEGLFINSGIGTAYYGIAELLVRSGYNVTVLYTRDTPTLNGSFGDWVNRYKAQDINLKFLPPALVRIANPKLQTTSLRVYRYLKANTYDIVHFADFEGLGYYSTLAKHNGLGFDNTVFVAGLHGPTRWILEANTGRSPAHESELEVDFMERLSVEYADYVWTPSSYLASWLSLQGWNFSSEIQLLPLPPGPEMQSTTAPITRTQPKEIVYFGRLEKRKGLLLFCDALDILSKMSSLLPQNLTVTFMGTSGFVDGQNSTDYVRSRTSSWPFNVKIVTDASRSAAISYLTEPEYARLPVIPSLVDNAPYTVFECLYAGIPFLASATPSIIPLLANGTAQNEHLFDTKPHNLASRLVTAFKSGVAPAASVYTVAQAEQAWISFYNRIQPKPVVASSTAQPLVSVVITHFNRPNLVSQAIQSVEAQDYSNYEIILVDDGSNDTAALTYLKSIEATFTQKNWKIIQTGNRYLGAARNAAAKVANGKYLLFLDDDNTAHPNQLSTYVKVAERTKANIFTSAHAIFKGVHAPVADKTERYWVPLGASLAVGLFKNCFGDANFFVDKDSFFAVGGFTEEYGVGLEDHEFFAKAVFAGQKLVVIPEALLYYRMHDEQSQMIFKSDPRMGEARRIRPYLAALAPESTSATTTDEQEDNTANNVRRSVVTLVARNALDTKEDCNQTLSSVSPSTGVITGGTLITIHGVGFSCGVTAVLVNGSACSSVTIKSNTEITCTTPPGRFSYELVDVTAEVGGQAVSLYRSFSYYPLAAPELDSCIVQDSGLAITCSFTAPTNQSSGSSCAGIFDTATTSKLGSGWKCTWVDSSTIDIDMGTDATIYFTDLVIIRAGMITSQGSNGLPNPDTSATLERPLNPVKPAASLAVPAAVGSCEGLTLDGIGSAGSAGRKFVVVWALVSVAPTSASDAVSASLTAASTGASLSVVVENTTLTVGSSYVFSLTLTNWLNQTSSTSATVIKSASSVPKVTISGNSLRQITRDVVLSLTGTAAPSCGTSLGAVTYLWSFTPELTELDASARTSATLTIPTLTFVPATIYIVTLSVTDSTSSLTNSANVTVEVGIRDLVAKIGGGNSQYHKDSDVVVKLDATNSSDPENLGPLSYSWSCASLDGSKSCPTNLEPGSVVVVNVADAVWELGTWVFTLTVSGAYNRTATATATVEILQATVLSILIDAPTKVDPWTDVILRGRVQEATDASLTWAWTLVSGTINENGYSSELTEQNLVIKAGYLAQGATYTYQLEAKDSTGKTGTASATFTVNKATSGNFGCVVATGSTSTQFNYTFAVSTAVQQYMITYKYSDIDAEIPVAEPMVDTNVITTLLPAGSLTITGYVLDSNGNVQSKDTCSATVSTATAGELTATAADSRSAFDVARIAFSARASLKGSDFSSVFSALLPLIASSSSAASVTANTGSLFVLTHPDHWTLSQNDLAALLGALGQLVSDQRSVLDSLDLNVLKLDLNILGNLLVQISKQEWSTGNDNTRAAMLSETDAYSQVVDLIDRVSSLVMSQIEAGQHEMDVNSDGLDISLRKVSNSNGVSVGPSSGTQVRLPDNFASVSSSASILFARYAHSPYSMGNLTLASRVMTLGVTADSAVQDLGASVIVITVPTASLLDADNYECQMLTDADQWTNFGVTQDTNNGRVTCTYPQQAKAYAVAAAAVAPGSNGGNNNGRKDGGISGGAIAGIAVGGAVALAAVVVGAAFGVRKYRGRAPRAAPAAGAPAISNAPIAPIAGPSVIAPVPTTLTGVAVEPQVNRGLPVVAGTPIAAAAVPGTGRLQPSPSASSSYSSGTRSYAGSSSSSEEEIMEQEIKNIVGELTHALPRDSRALEVLGDKLEME